MRYLAVLQMPVFGGPHQTFARLAAPLAERGWDLTVVLPREAGNAAERFRSVGVDPVTLPLHRPRATASPIPHVLLAATLVPEVRALRRLVVSRGIDVVVSVGPENLHGLLAARAARAASVCQLVGTWLPARLRPPAMRMIGNLADVVMSVGRTVIDEHPGVERLGSRLLTFIPPVDMERFAPPGQAAREAARRELGLDEGVVIGNVSNLNPQKDHMNFVRAAAEVRRSRPGTRFVILGSKHASRPEIPLALETEARRLGLRLGEDLVMHDPGERVAELAAAFDIFWLTSGLRGEGVPTVLGEAMALELPVVSTDVAGVREIVDPASTGRLVPPQDPSALAQATVPLVDDEELRRRLGRAGRARAHALCSPETCAELHVQAFESAMAHCRRVRDDVGS